MATSREDYYDNEYPLIYMKELDEKRKKDGMTVFGRFIMHLKDLGNEKRFKERIKKIKDK